ncbi:DUF1289 domain-containing protein [Hyphomicrobium sulfonivorans]|uniref:DUF1289 domain-containing protein n=1 Tax=Hyphomicrobium sulfonivorans TaxID=121290 RepID=UPI00156E384B|nr:DUF1289 domain-containing protein [Hyphomicrobium sulfonivorans]MBI1649177.1 DUF1289 domain-containing protein [Hyphomicrobium sulfonivorans]NSL70292.1 DUF1289 domain-containing protein [Hyphomicrobium sulfonivorans]
MNLAARRQRHSPCIGVCKLDEASGLCLGCARTGDEIGAWAGMGEAARDAIWQQLPERFKALAVRVRLLPSTSDEIQAWVAKTIEQRQGTWVVGPPGAVAEFPCRPDRDIAVTIDEDGVTARAPDAIFRLNASDKLRAFAFDDDGPTVLGFPQVRATLSKVSTVTSLGADYDAVDVDHRSETLFDLGVDRRFSRFCVRTGNAELAAKLRGFIGQPWSAMMAGVGMDIIQHSPARVVETAQARIEVFAPIPPPDGKAPDGAHTHFLPQFLATGEEIPSTLELPSYAAPVAIFYPAKPPA